MGRRHSRRQESSNRRYDHPRFEPSERHVDDPPVGPFGEAVQLADPPGCCFPVREHPGRHVLEARRVEPHLLPIYEIAEQPEGDPDAAVNVAGPIP